MDVLRTHPRNAEAAGGAHLRAPQRAALTCILALLVLLLLAAEAQAYGPGQLIYAKRIGSSTSEATSVAVAAAPNGATVIAGWKESSAVPAGIVTIVAKYTVTGKRAWLKTYAAIGRGAEAVACDRSGNVYVAGWSEYDVSGTLTNSAITIKFGATDGVKKWGQVYKAQHNPGSYADHMTLAGSTVVITGSTERSVDNERDALIVKYSLSGTEKYWMEWGVDDGHGEFFSEVVLDGKGKAFVTGDQWLVRGTGTGKAITMKLNATLSKVVWKKPYQPAGRYATGSYIARDGLGNLYVSGVRQTFAGDTDVLTMKYSPSGVRKWLKGWYGGGPHHDEPWGLALGTMGGVHITGEANASGDYGQAVLLKYQR